MPVYKDTEGKWYYKTQYTDIKGIRKQKKSKRFDTKREAVDAEARFKALQGEVKDTNASYTINDMCDYYSAYKEERMKRSSYIAEQNKMVYIRDMLGSIRIVDLTANQYQTFVNNLKSLDVSNGHRNRILQLMRAMIKFMEKRYGVTSRVPFIFDDFKVKKHTRRLDFWTIEEFKAFIRVVDDERYFALYTLLFYEGLRIGEANALTWNDIDFNREEIDVNKTVNTKLRDEKGDYVVTDTKTESSNRVIPIMSKRVTDTLKSLLLKDEQEEGFSMEWKVFGKEKSIPDSQIQKKKKDYLEKANALLISEGKKPLKEIRIHGFRHSCACFLINAVSANPAEIASLLGHSSIKETLDTYSSFYPSKMKAMRSMVDATMGDHE